MNSDTDVASGADDVFASVLVDLVRCVQIAPRLLPESFGPAGRYRLEELIGLGRDSHVYRAVDLHLSKPSAPAHVAVKIRPCRASARAEALVGRSVVHDNVVRIIDHGVTDDGESYVVQEWVPGGDLTSLSPPLEPARAARLVAAIARGVQALHSAGNVHGDIKPSNVLLADGSPKVTDFDLASAADLDLVNSGGNLALIAPERLLGEEPRHSPLSDIYSLGGLLYYFLTGRGPHGLRREDIIEAHRSSTPPAPLHVERDLARICARALARSPDDRYRSAEALAADLDLWLAHRPIRWTRPTLLRRSRLLVRRRPLQVAIGVLALATTATAVGWIQLSIAHKLEAQRLANELAAAELRSKELALAELEATMRRNIKEFVSYGVKMRSAENSSSTFAALVWVDWIADCDVLGDSGPVIARSARLDALARLRQHYQQTGQSGTLSDAMAAYCLAFLHLEGGDADAAARLVEDADSGIVASLPPHDDLRRSVETLRLLVALEQASAQGRAAEADALRRRIVAQREQLLALDGTHDLAGLIQLVFARHPPPVPSR